MMNKVTIIDCFITSGESEEILLRTLESLKDQDILIVTNKSVSKEIQNKVKAVLYDSRNQLFRNNDYDYTKHSWNFWIDCGYFMAYHFYLATQIHGLSVIVNLLNSLNLAKSLGYTHFQYVQYDSNYSEESIKWILSVPEVCESLNKRGLVYYNVDSVDHLKTDSGPEYPTDMNLGYIFSEIDYFLSKIPKINNEEEYRDLLIKEFGYLRFLVVEKYIFHFLRKNGDSDLLIKTQIEYKEDFKGLKEALQTSPNNFPAEYQGCPTRITKIENSDQLVVFSHNFSGSKNRTVRVFKGDVYFDQPHFIEKGSWSYFAIDPDVDRIEIYDEDGSFLYSEENNTNEIKNYLKYY
jgi:hypothetical protein